MDFYCCLHLLVAMKNKIWYLYFIYSTNVVDKAFDLRPAYPTVKYVGYNAMQILHPNSIYARIKYKYRVACKILFRNILIISIEHFDGRIFLFSAFCY